MLRCVAALLFVAVLGADGPGARVRSNHPYIRAMIAEAQVRSPTFRRLVQAVEATDGIVYVEEGDCHRRLRSCLPPVVTSAGNYRFLRVLVDARQEDWQVMSDIGHELQHALEVLRDPNARTNSDVFYLWVRAAFDTTDVYETAEAVAAGDAVKREVKAFANSSTTKGLVRTSP
jgi:hypothetical protein